MTKAVDFQFVGVIHSRPHGTADNSTNLGQFVSTDDTGVIARIGSYNRPAAPGDTVFTSLIACVRECISINREKQEREGVNTRYTVYGKLVGTPPTGNRLSIGSPGVAGRAPTTAELAEYVYVDGDTPAAGLYDVRKYLNSVPTQTSAIVIRDEAGPESEATIGDSPSGL